MAILLPALAGAESKKFKSNFIAGDWTIWKVSYINQTRECKLKRIFSEDIEFRKHKFSELFGCDVEWQDINVITLELDSAKSRDELVRILNQRLIPLLRPSTGYDFSQCQNSNRNRKVFLKRREAEIDRANRATPPYLVFFPVKYYTSAIRIIHTEFELLFPWELFFSKESVIPYDHEPRLMSIPESQDQMFPSLPWQGNR